MFCGEPGVWVGVWVCVWVCVSWGVGAGGLIYYRIQGIGL